MAIIKKNDINELVGGDMFASGNDKATTNNSEIETGPVDKPYNDNSDYEKGMQTTTDRVVSRYRQNIPWFAVYSYGGTRTGSPAGNLRFETEENKTLLTKKAVEEKIDDLVKKSKNADLTPKNYDAKLDKIIDTIADADLTEKQLEDLKKAIAAKESESTKVKNL